MLKIEQTVTTLIVLASVTLAINESSAGPVRVQGRPRSRVNTKWEAKADKNNDGIVQRKEAHKAISKENQKSRAEVDSKWEAKADKNNDGIVQPKEAHKAIHKGDSKSYADVDHKWKVKADKNGDGVVSALELRKHNLHVIDKNSDGHITVSERDAYWIHKNSKVNTKVEKTYDRDGNGWISGYEACAMLKARLRLIKVYGKARVDSAIEAEYDANQDGFIDKREAESIRDTLGSD